MKRYDLDHVDSISEFEDGDYVRYDEAAARIAELECELRAIKRNRCEHCGAKSSDYPSGCPTCGAPQCCEPCCKRQQAEDERDAARTELAAVKARYTWCANELFACDYGDNAGGDGQVGWITYGWRQNTWERPHNQKRRIYGASIDIAVDSQLAAEKGAQ